MKLIIVEDDNDQITSYLDTITALNELDGGQIDNPKVVKTLTEALAAIENEPFDAAILDLKLSSNQNETQGNEVIKLIVNLKRFPVFVYSAYLGDIDSSIPESFFFQKFEKTTPIRDLLIKLRDIYKTGVTRILGANGLIENHLTKIFWNHIAESFEDLSRNGINEKQLLRYITGHLYEYLEMGDTAGSFERYLPEEVYIKPPIKQKYFTGSIVKEKNSEKKFIILTPSCDIANCKAEHVLLALIYSLTTGLVRGLKSEATKTIRVGLSVGRRQVAEDKKKKAEDDLKRLFRNNYSPKYYFLPPSRNFEGGLINFQDLESVEHPGTMSDRFDIIATVNSQFLKDIVARFAFYYSRQGAPEIEFSIADLP